MVCGYNLLSLFVIITVSYTSGVSRFKAESTTQEIDHETLLQDMVGPTTKDPTKLVYHLKAEDSLNQYIEQNNSEPYTVLLVEKATETVVSGLLTRLDFLASYLCKPPSKGNNNPSKCQPENVYKVLKCHAEIWDQLWTHMRQTTVDCTPL